MEQTDLLAELSRTWRVRALPEPGPDRESAWTIGVFGLSILLDDCGAEGESARRTPSASCARRREFMKSHVV